MNSVKSIYNGLYDVFKRLFTDRNKMYDSINVVFRITIEIQLYY